MTNRKEQLKAFDRLLTIMDELRAQCPWDKKQTMETLRPLTIEETYELADAILDQNLEIQETINLKIKNINKVYNYQNKIFISTEKGITYIY